MGLALTKTYNPHDYSHLPEELALLDPWPTSAPECRHWASALTLRAVRVWSILTSRQPRFAIIVGGDQALQYALFHHVRDVILLNAEALARYPGPPGDVLVLLECLEYLEQPIRFLRSALRFLYPDGLLVIGAAYWDCQGPDPGTGRRRIYQRQSWEELLAILRKLHCSRLGATDWSCPAAAEPSLIVSSLVYGGPNGTTP